jgi:hypothetical protein
MIEPLALATTVSCLVLGLVILIRAAVGRYRWRTIMPSLVVVQSAVVIQAVAVAVALVTGHRPGEPATHVAYLAASVLVLPVAAAQTARDDGGWAGVLVAVAVLVLAVVVVRMQATWRPSGG